MTRLASAAWTREELEMFESALRERRDVLLEDMESLEAVLGGEASLRSISATHLADLGSDQAASDLTLRRRESESGEIQEIDEALERIQDGSYGLCEQCGTRISRTRLEAIPYARLCLACKRTDEG